MTDISVTQPTSEAPLESWKEIAAYLKRDVRTVKRWEHSEGLPVHRHLHRARSSVYAYPSELEAWRAARRPIVEAVAPQWTIARAAAGVAVLAIALATAGDGGLGSVRAQAQSSTGLVVRQVWTGPDVSVSGSVSPDGQLLSFVDRMRNLAIRELGTGTSRRLTTSASLESPAIALGSIFSTDGRFVAYTWYRFNRDTKRDEWELRVASIDGSGDELVLADRDGNYLEPRGWSQDGKAILTVWSMIDGSRRIGLVSMAGGSVKLLKTLDRRMPAVTTLSPDGRFLVYDLEPREGARHRDIFLLAVDGGLEHPLVQHAADDMPLGWTPDGSRLLFASDRTGTVDCWSLTIVDGRPQGSPALIKRDLGRVEPLGVARNGTLYYAANVGAADVYSAEVDFASGTVMSQPKAILERFVGANGRPEWSPDGKWLAYSSARERTTAIGQPSPIVVRSLATGQERELPLRGFRNLHPGRWCTGGFFVAAGEEVDAPARGIYRIDAQSGAIAPLVPPSAVAFPQMPECLPDGRTIVFGRRTEQGGQPMLTLVRRDIASGAEREVHRFGDAILHSLSAAPDGRSLALALIGEDGGARIALVSLAGGTPRDLARLRRPESVAFDSVTWSADSRLVLFVKPITAGRQRTYEAWAIPVERGDPFKLGLSMPGLSRLRVHPDGRRVAFQAGESQREIWAIEGIGR